MENTVWDAEWAKDMSENGGRFGPKRVREAVYKDNCMVFGRWAYPLPNGLQRDLGDRRGFLAGTKVYARPFDVNDVPAQAEPTKTGCINADCIEVARDMLANGYRVSILNLASRRRPCGGYDQGLNAQEEALCRQSTLSQSLYQYYDASKACVRHAGVPARYNAYPLDLEFGGIYSPDVAFFREDLKHGYAFRPQPFACGVITVAALSFREPNNYCNEERQYMAPDGGFTPQGDAIQLNKIRTIFRLALKNGHDSIVLGAFGCGVNKLPCQAVADQFRRVLEEPEFKGKFKALVFAILEGRGSARHPVEEQGKFAPFYEMFGRWRQSTIANSEPKVSA